MYNKCIVTMTNNIGVMEQIITVISLETEEILTTQSCTLNNYVEKIIGICDFFNTTFVAIDEELWDWEFTNNNLSLLKEGEVIPKEENE